MKKILTISTIASALLLSPLSSAYAMEDNGVFHTDLSGLKALAAMCRYKVEKPVPQQIKNRFIQAVLEQAPELKTRAMAFYRETESYPRRTPKNPEEEIIFKNYAFHPKEPEISSIGYPNHYRVYIGAHCPLDLQTEDVVPCFATMACTAPALVRADLKEILLGMPEVGYLPVDEWRELYNKELKEKEEDMVNDCLSPFPEWFN